jgi:hypothetical protein
VWRRPGSRLGRVSPASDPDSREQQGKRPAPSADPVSSNRDGRHRGPDGGEDAKAQLDHSAHAVVVHVTGGELAVVGADDHAKREHDEHASRVSAQAAHEATDGEWTHRVASVPAR